MAPEERLRAQQLRAAALLARVESAAQREAEALTLSPRVAALASEVAALRGAEALTLSPRIAALVSEAAAAASLSAALRREMEELPGDPVSQARHRTLRVLLRARHDELRARHDELRCQVRTLRVLHQAVLGAERFAFGPGTGALAPP